MGAILSPENTTADQLRERRDNVLIFLHIPKTGGVTLERILIRQYNAALIYPFLKQEEYPPVLALAPEVRNRYRLFQGHFPYGLHEYLDHPSIYVTQLREPLDTVMSSYFYFELYYREHFQQREIQWKMPNVQDMRNSKMRLMFDNLQTRHLSHNLHQSFGKITREMLETAKENLNRFAVVGLTERYDETILLMTNTLGWRAPYYVKANVTQLRPRQEPMSDEVKEWLTEQNQLDLELYEHAKMLFQQQVEKQGAGFGAAVQEYKRQNARLGVWFDRLSRAKNKAQHLPIVGEFV